AFGLGLIGRMWLERSLGLWWSRVEGNDDPLMLLSPLTWFVFFVGSAVLLVVLLMIGRRFGWKGQILSLAVLGLYQAVRERIWIGRPVSGFRCSNRCSDLRLRPVGPTRL